MTDPYLRAKKKVKAKKGFYGHLAAYVFVNLFMLVITMTQGEGLNWLIPMSGWGIGLGMHYIRVFGWPGSGAGSLDWEEKELQKELEKEGYDLRDFEDEEEGLELKQVEKVKRRWRDDDFV